MSNPRERAPAAATEDGMVQAGARLTRRQFAYRLAGCGVAALGAGLLSACAAVGRPSSGPSIPHIGYLTPKGWPSIRSDGVMQGLAQRGYSGDRVQVDTRTALGDAAMRDQADQLVAANPDVIIAGGHQAIRATMAATRTIPIVMAADGDPVGTGLVASLAHPGGNVTGLSLLSVGLSRKRLEIFKQAIPTLSRVGVEFDPAAADKQHDMEETQQGAKLLGVEVVPVALAQGGDVSAVWAAAAREHGSIDALLTLWDGFVAETAQFALANRMPSMCEGRGFVAGGGLMSFGPTVIDWYPRAAFFVDRILKGVRPADLPVEQPTEFELVINLTTARALGLTIPDSVLAMATLLP